MEIFDHDTVLSRIDAFISEHREQIIRDIAELVAVPSVQGEAEEGAPFGAAPAEALRRALAQAERLGLRSVNCDGYAGYAELPGESPEYFAAVTHVDVVPAGEGWLADPFTLRRKDAWLLGRGTSDDKGPTVICLYALAFLKEYGASLPYAVRAVIGANEESGMQDMPYYCAHEPAPRFAFSPDADFPLIHGEKGIVRLSLRSRCKAVNVLSISGGDAVNAVPGRAEALVRGCKKPAAVPGLEVAPAAEGWRLTAHGKGGHAAHPEGTVNALGLLIRELLSQKLLSPSEEPYFRFLEKVQANPDGSGAGIDSRDDIFSPLTAVSGMMAVEEDGCFSASLDCRIPTSTSGEKIRSILEQTAAGSAEIQVWEDTPYLYLDPSSPEIRACLSAYREVTGDISPSYTIGGGTYAKHLPNTVAFGADMPQLEVPDFVGRIHGAEEGASEQALLDALKIYILTLLKLEGLS